MSKFEIPLNGSNIVNPERKQAFEDALKDDHRVQCEDDQQIKIAESTYKQAAAAQDQIKTSSNPNPVQSGSPINLDQVVDHAYAHQVRTMDVHQQFLNHQREQIDLISKILTKQGDVLKIGPESEKPTLLNTFQRTLDNFQVIREQSLQVHQTFLNQQSDFSDRILDVIGGPRQSSPVTENPEPKAKSAEQAWVVHDPNIVIEDELKQKTTQEKEPENLSAPAETSSDPVVDTDELAETLLKIVSENTGYPAEMLDLTMDLEADLGIDSIKRVEILAVMEETYPSLQSPDPEILAESRTLEQIIAVMNTAGNGDDTHLQKEEIPSSPQPNISPEPKIVPETDHKDPVQADYATPSSRDLLPILLEIVAENTGYPVEMLESSMDMEADLGIDSIKRVEILAEMEDRVEGLPTPDAAVLAETRTIGEIAELMDSAESALVSQSVSEEEGKKKDTSPELRVERVELKYLPQPDSLNITPGENNLIILSNDGTDLTPALAKSLTEDGWEVVTWDYPEHLITEIDSQAKITNNRIRQESTGKESIQVKLEEIKSEYGTPLGFIHLHPTAEQISDEIDQELIEQVFFIAGSIRQHQTDLDDFERSFFFAVTRNDGFLGLKSGNQMPAGSGLSGLIKSIRWEWSDVFCRAVDLQRDIPVEDACSHLLKEIHDPDHGLVDLGINVDGRVTLETES